MEIIKTNQLTKYYGQHKGIENVNLTIHPQEIFGFIGPNGAGKSTTIRTLLGLIKKTSGQAYIFGKDIENHPIEILKDIGYLPSEVYYYDRMKAIDLFKYANSFYADDHSERIHYLAEVLSLDLNQRIETMSYGNRKKVGIIQGLLHQPKLIILDEPTSGLDPLMQKSFFELIRLEKEQGNTILFSSHNLAEVQRICDRVAIIKNGTIIETQDLKTTQKTRYKKIRLESAQPLQLHNLPEVRDYQKENLSQSFLYSGDLNLLIQQLQNLEIQNLEILDPSLEEIFLHYYED